MTETTLTTPADSEQQQAGFFINAGTHGGWFTTPDGDVYDIRKLEPREVTDPRDGTITTLWGGYATARDRDLAARDAMLQTDFKKTGARPADFFAAESKDIPLYITLRNRPGKPNEKTGKPSYTDIGSFWNAKGRYTILARDLSGKSGLRFGGNVLAWRAAAATTTSAVKAEPSTAAPDANATPQAATGLDSRHDADLARAERDRAFDLSPSGYVDRTPNSDSARTNAATRSRKSRGKAPTAEA